MHSGMTGENQGILWCKSFGEKIKGFKVVVRLYVILHIFRPEDRMALQKLRATARRREKSRGVKDSRKANRTCGWRS